MANNEKRVYNAFSPYTGSQFQIELTGSLNRMTKKLAITHMEFEFLQKKKIMVFMYLTMFLFSYFVGLKATL